MAQEKSIYNLSREWFNFCFENPEKINPTHTALYFFCIEHCNRLGWKDKFGLPTTMAKEAIGIHSYNTYINALNDLIKFGFIKLIQKSQNQYSSNIIALSNFDKSLDKPLDKALIKHTTKQCKSTEQSNDSILIQDTIEQEQQTNNGVFSFDEFWSLYPTKTRKDESKKKYEKLSLKDKQKIFDTLQAFIDYKPFPTYNHPMAATYINQKRWNDEIPVASSEPILDFWEQRNQMKAKENERE